MRRWTELKRVIPVYALLAACWPGMVGTAQTAPLNDVGPAVAHTEGAGAFSLQNKVIGARWEFRGGRLTGLKITDRLHGQVVSLDRPFEIVLRNGTVYRAEDMEAAGGPAWKELVPRPAASRLAERFHGEEFVVPLETADHALRAKWTVELRDGSTYLRQLVSIEAAGGDVPISRVEMIDLDLPEAHVSGSVHGSPIVAGNLFAGFESPLSEASVAGGRATAWIDRLLPLRAGQSITYSSVVGVARAGQMRRDFLAYVERERAHPYRTFLHYNSWYDLGLFTPYDSAIAVERVNAFGRELVEKRGVKMDSFLFDDGWDNHRSLWQFNSGFPHGFTPVRAAAEKYGAEPGVWMSPWGGYAKPKQERIAFGKSAGYEIVDGGYALSGPKYYAAFRDVCLKMIRVYGVNQFKFDGTGNVNSVVAGSSFDSDFAAMMHLIGELRAAKPDIYINLTTGTWPSPFWLLYADSIWRGGQDDSTAGVGTYRERWITYRDGETYKRVVRAGPLYPLNSLMLHGLIYARLHQHLDKDPGNDFRNEIRSYFGTGTQLQEMYVTPGLLSQANWDDLAEAAKWSRAHADVLKDSHWVGGDPEQLQVYGWASWSRRMAILVLRNPSDKPQSIEIRLQDVLGLPEGAAQVYSAKSPWREDAGRRAMKLDAREARQFRLAPFEVLTLDLNPQR
ncbi:MAG TPA: enterotoxin [Terracidiphilus sp.]|nr:enterotoxin [Terracidiphilus sp.]